MTIDDLPWNGETASGESVLQANRRLLSAFVQRGLHVTGFVVCGKESFQETVLRVWLESGMELGNHTSNHLDLHQAPPDEWVADVTDCHRRLSGIVRQPIRFFRYPMLHQGMTEEQRNASRAALERLDYEIAHVTIDNSEWLLAAAYSRALARGDEAELARIARGYVEHLLSGLRHFDEVAESLLGRRPPHILLLHANALNADHVGSVLDAFQAEGVRIISLAEALSDPVFGMADTYTGRKGVSWLYRLQPGAFERWGAWDDTEAERIRASYGGPGAP